MNFSVQLDDGKRSELGNLLFPNVNSNVIFVKRIMNWRLVKLSRGRMVRSNSILSDPRSFVITADLYYIFLLVANVEKSVKFLDVICGVSTLLSCMNHLWHLSRNKMSRSEQ